MVGTRCQSILRRMAVSSSSDHSSSESGTLASERSPSLDELIRDCSTC